MEVVTGAGANIVTEVGKGSVKVITRHVGYLFRFNNNVKELGKAKKDLISNQEQVQANIERAALNAEVVNKNVEAWLNNVKEVVEDVETLENKIKANKVCCNGWCPNLIRRYKQSKEVVEKTINVKDLKDTGSFTQVAHRALTPGLEIFSSSDFEGFESRKWGFDQIMEALRDDNSSSSRIGVWGMGGVGKTTLVKEVNKKAKTLGLFNDIVMAVISQTPDIRRIQNEIAGHLNLKLEENDDSERARRICMRIRNVEKILVVLDDVWKFNDVNFEGIGIPNDHKGCKFLITTRSEHVCNAMSCEKKVSLTMVTEEESLALFKKSASIDDDFLAKNDDVVRNVVKECQGLPIAIVAVGKALIQKSPNDWNVALKQLRESKLTEIEGVDEEKNAYVCLKWSYNHLKRKSKLCFLLCSLFPEDYNIRIEELTRYVIGLEEEYEEVKLNTEEVRSQVSVAINSLKDSSLLLVGDKEDSVKMHDMVRDVALWIASKGDNEFSLRANTSLKGIRNFESVTAISLWANNTKQFPDKLVCPKLNILLLYEDYNMKNLPEISETLFEGMKGLKVLSLRGKFLSSQSLQFLTNLRCLYLVNCNFDDLSSLGKLKSLEILSFRFCQMVALPNELGELNNLKVLDLFYCQKLERIPPNLIQALSQLEELYFGYSNFKNWDVEGTRNASLSELMSLSNLAVLSLNFDANMNSFPKGFVFPKLQRYEISIHHSTNEYPKSRVLKVAHVNASSLNVFKELFCTVEELMIEYCEVECFIDITGRNSTATFSNLVELELNGWSRLTNLFSLSLVQNLKKLETLILKSCSELKQIISEEESLFKYRNHIQPPCFPKLRILKVIDCGKLEYLFSISVAQVFLLQLENLIIEDLPELKQVFHDDKEREVGLDGNKFELFELRELSLKNLPELSSFRQGNISSTWPSLERLSVMSCPKMTSSFVANLEANVQAVGKKLQVLNVSNCSQLCNTVLDLLTQGLSDLEELRIESCEGLEDLFQRERLLPSSRLKILSLKDLLVQRCVWKGPTQFVNLNNLKKFKVCQCNRLRQLFSLATLAQSLQQLEYLTIKECEELEHLIVEDEEDRILLKGHPELVYLKNLKSVRVSKCKRLRHLFTLTLARSLQQLHSFTIEECDELEHIIVENEEDHILLEGHLQPLYFPKLIEVNVKECNKMKSLFPITIAHSLQQLSTLTVEGASQLVEVFAHENERDVGIRKDIRLHNLWWLTLDRLPSLVSFCQMNYHFILPDLKFFKVQSCPNMRTSFALTLDFKTDVHVNGEEYVISMGSYFPDTYLPRSFFLIDYSKSIKLRLVDVDAPSMNAFKVFYCTVEELELEKCEVECFNDTTGGDNTITFSNLIKLILKDMPSLRTMWERPIQQTTFRNLIFLEARSCSRMSNLFSPSLVQNLKRMETLILERCSELKQIISEDEILLKCHHIQPPCFPKLRILKVIDCGKLEYLFSISVARGFILQLEELVVEDLPELKQVFGNEKEADIGLDGDKFELSGLAKLSLHKLPKLSSFCQGNISSTWPSLKRLSVMSCPKMTPSFVADLAASLETVGKEYTISSKGDRSNYSNLKVLILDVVDASSLNAFKVFFGTVELLQLSSCEIECFNDTIGGNNTATFSNLDNLTLGDMPSLRTLWQGPIQHTTFRNLSFLRVYNCSELTNPLPLPLCQNLEKLKTLVLESCSKLKQIISEDEMLFNCNIQPKYFPKLRTLKVIDCGKLEYLFLISVARGFLLQLEEVIVEDLPELKQLFGSEREADIGLDGDKFELSKLAKLSLHKLPKLSNFCQGNISSMWPSLEKLSVMSCPKMTPSFVADLAASLEAIGKKLQAFNVSNCSRLCNTVLDLLTQGLLDLEELKIESCEGLEDLFQRERLLPSWLKILSLKDLLVQRCVWKGPTQLVNLNNLKEFKVCQCNKLRQLFSLATVAQSLRQLESLTIEECDELEHLVAKDEEDHISEGHLQPLYFPKLKYVFVKECNKMKSLFPITIAHSLLQQLRMLKVEGASQLVEVFAHEDEGDVGVRIDIRLPMLLILRLKLLSSLVNFCPRNYHFILPKLQYLKVLSCPNMSTSFARTPDFITTVHVNGEVPQLGEKDELVVLSSNHQEVAVSPTNKDTDWHRYEKLDALPLFKEEPPK